MATNVVASPCSASTLCLLCCWYLTAGIVGTVGKLDSHRQPSKFASNSISSLSGLHSCPLAPIPDVTSTPCRGRTSSISHSSVAGCVTLCPRLEPALQSAVCFLLIIGAWDNDCVFHLHVGSSSLLALWTLLRRCCGRLARGTTAEFLRLMRRLLTA